MFIGLVKFKCESHETIFEAPDIEDNATVKSYPQRCPKRHTLYAQGEHYTESLVTKLLKDSKLTQK